VTGIGDDPFATARAWLPVAAGCPTIAITAFDQIATLSARVTALTNTVVTLPSLPAEFDATIAARRLVELVRITHQRRLLHRA
jgi:hypothetical protein